jgi:redox-sensitive bicupin YhaK (pirin superfamily)
MNDDYVQPNRGFGTHGHKDMEIITYIVQGKLTHVDSMGTEETLGRGRVSNL